MNANSIISAFWLAFHVFSDKSLLSRVRSEIAECHSGSSSPSSTFDNAKLFANPLLQSLYAETLRLHMAAYILRSPERATLRLDRWVFPKDTIIDISTYHAQMDDEVWSTGYNGSQHPLNEFWADRFLVYPGIPKSGPLKVPVVTTTQPVKPNENVQNQKPCVKGPFFSLEGLEGAWFPYGGGQRICPGRHFAKQEMLLTLAMLCSKFEIDVGHTGTREPDHDWSAFGFGALSPSTRTPFKIKTN